jgi:hypothetical protein
MQAIWKTVLMPGEFGVTCRLPKNAKILCVQNQNEKCCIWFINPDVKSDEIVERTFYIYGTGHEHEEIKGRYVGTFQLGSGLLVFHVFEKVS